MPYPSHHKCIKLGQFRHNTLDHGPQFKNQYSVNSGNLQVESKKIKRHCCFDYSTLSTLSIGKLKYHRDLTEKIMQCESNSILDQLPRYPKYIAIIQLIGLYAYETSKHKLSSTIRLFGLYCIVGILMTQYILRHITIFLS